MAKVKAVPDGYQTVTPFLNVDGAAEALELYKKAFGAEERFRQPTPDGKIMHSELQIGSSVVMVSDAMRNAPTQSSCHLYVDDVDALFKRATAAGMTVIMPLENMFWGDRYGLLVDKFGNRWSLASHVEDVAPDEMERRGIEAMKKMKG